MSDEYRLSSTHAEDLEDGRVVAPGQVVSGVDPEKPHNRRLIEEGKLVRPTPIEKPKASDAARSKAAELGVALEDVQGTGAGGAIKVEDVETAAEAREKEAAS